RLIRREADRLDQQVELALVEDDRRARAGVGDLVAGFGQVQRRAQVRGARLMSERGAAHPLGALQQRQLARVESQPQRAPAVAPLVLGLRHRGPARDRRWMNLLSPALTAAKMVPRATFHRISMSGG